MGDGRQELVFIGTNMPELELRSMLDGCLLTDEEMAMGVEAWLNFSDPMPRWPAVQLSEIPMK